MDSNTDDTTGIEEAQAPEAPRPGAKEVAAHIRSESRAAALTDPSTFAQEPFSLDEEEMAQVMSDLAQGEEYTDIVRTADERSGTDYLHSTTFLTVFYARHLIRAQADDPVYLIVSTVRENSEVYPKPTSLEFFRSEPFSLDFDDVVTYAKAILADEGCADIKSVKATNGMVYLYSDKFLSQAQALGMAQWVEVDMYLDSNQ